MEIEKESNREAFEKAFAQTEFYRNKADLYSLLADIDDETFDFFRKNGFGDYSIGEAQAAWSAWQAAKAQAIPDGFVVVSQKDLLELTIAINAVDLATHTESKTNEVREMWQQVALKLGALCSTGASQ